MSAAPGVAAAWTRTYVVEWNEPARYYGGKDGRAVEPGSDCPKGANPDLDWTAVLLKAGYAPADARALLDLESRTLTREQQFNQMAFRGRNRANVFADPASTPDPGFVEVTEPDGGALVMVARSYRDVAAPDEPPLNYPTRPTAYRVVDGLSARPGEPPAPPLTPDMLRQAVRSKLSAQADAGETP